MWPRVVELMLGCWLGVSPFTFRHNPQQRELWLNDLACALAIVTLSLLSFWRPCRAAHFGLCGVAIWLIRFGYAMAPIPAPPVQNDILVGMLLLMFAIIPNEANVPPRSWSDLGS